MVMIHKYQFELASEFEIEMPEKAKILDVQEQNGTYAIWALVETSWAMEKRKFCAVWTGEELSCSFFWKTHIATIQDIYVWHIFE